MSLVLSAATVSVLNASYEPLGDTRLARAIALVNNGLAEIEEADESRILRFANGTFLYPKVIRLLKFIMVPFRDMEEIWSRNGVLRRDGHMCAYCGKTPKNTKMAMTIDHIVAKSLGGQDTWKNTVTCCQPCNSLKSNKTMEEWGKPLLFQPTVPMKRYLISGKKPGSKVRKN